MIHEQTPKRADEGYGFRRLLGAVKEEVSVARLADDLGAELRGTDKGMRGLCPIHGGRNRQSFAVYGERWYCYRCSEGGDVLDLFAKARGYYDLKAALTDLAGVYGVQSPPRSERWREWQTEKARRRDAIRDVRTRLYQRRMFRMFTADLERIEDETERETEAKQVYADLYHLARSCAEWRVGR